MKKYIFFTGGLLLFMMIAGWKNLHTSRSATATIASQQEQHRKMNAAEYQFALSLFPREFPPRDQITLTNSTGLQNRNYVRPTVDGDIRINMGSLYSNLLGSQDTKGKFAHELTHAWQIEHYGLIWYGKQALDNQVLSDNAYAYTCDTKKKLDDYNAEQQGEIIKHYFLGGACETNIAQRALSSATWKLLIGSDGRDMAVDANGGYYLVNSAGIIYRYTGNDWQQMAGSAGWAIAANGGKVCLVNTAGKLYQLVNNSTWQQMPGSDGSDIAIDSDGTIWMVNTAGKIYKYNGSAWTQMQGSDGRRISAGGGQVWLTNSAGKIYKYNGSGWTQTTGSDGRDITVSNDGKVFLTNTAGKIYQWNNNQWTQLDGSDGVGVSANAGRLVMYNTKGRLYYRMYGGPAVILQPIKAQIRQ